MGLSDEEIARIRETGEMMPFLPVRAPFAASILESGGIPGTAIETGAVLMSMADLSTLWVLADVYEKNLGMVQIGSPAEIRTAAYPGQTFRGRLTAQATGGRGEELVGARRS
jgi:multidrug resistance efflux pump